MIDTGHQLANAVLARELDLFERVAGPRCYVLSIVSHDTPAIFELSQDELDAADPWAWPHHYDVLVVHDFGYWKSKVVHSIVHDLPGAIRALVEGVELGVSDSKLNDWMLTRLSS